MEFDTNPLLALAVIVLSGVLAGQLAHRLRAPRITGPIVIGVVLGATGIHLFSAATIDSLAVVTEFALGLIALSIGDHLNVARLRNAGRRLFLLLVTEASFVTLLLVAGTAHALGVSVLLSCLFLGVALANLTPNKEELGAAAFQSVEAVIFAAFFTLAGIHLDFSLVVPAGVTALILIAARHALGRSHQARPALPRFGAYATGGRRGGPDSGRAPGCLAGSGRTAHPGGGTHHGDGQ